jgi:CHAD domain-containing protein
MNSNPHFLKWTVRNGTTREKRSQSVASASGGDAQVDTMSEGIRTAMQDLTNAQIPSSQDLIRCWNNFSAEWKKVRRGFSEPSIHDFRVSIRRMISELEFAFAVTHAPEVHTSIDAVTASYASFRSSRSAQDFHRMRIKFKRFRYAAEIAKPIPGVFTKKQMDRMRELQRLMGEIHDLQTYMAAIEEWSGTRVPVRLQQEYDALMKAFNDWPGKFEEFTFRVRTKMRSVKDASGESLS